ncbi:MAG: hypothetical protein JRJ42_03560 [Deltaproteobacteria bacterium]|nr:hypothetical protein [Deltaproteobacteria bacterium]MBW2018454.1 hypothetical protein [Deltaproteobacteria bacterium]MBW2074111.1 hypothetical protein [Deltaproteobacteria bacterium]RLB83613.1 MAG: hypothetical protein DRH17_01690 [Deltaproteobacteria bacterium]
MNHNKFFTIEIHESEDQPLTLTPSEYLETLHPHKAIAEMQEYIEMLEDALNQYDREHIWIPVNIGKVGSLAFELELVRTFLAFFKQAYGTMH